VDRDAKAGGQLRNELSSKGMTCGLVTAELSTPEGCSRAVDERQHIFVDGAYTHLDRALT
jgi:hypothetical protein